MKQVILTLALMVSANACSDTSIEREEERKQRYARVTANYNKCVERVKQDYNPDAIASIARCRQWAIIKMLNSLILIVTIPTFKQVGIFMRIGIVGTGKDTCYLNFQDCRQ